MTIYEAIQSVKERISYYENKYDKEGDYEVCADYLSKIEELKYILELISK